MRRGSGKRAAAWILSAAMVFGNSSFAALAEEVQEDSVVMESAVQVPEMEETVTEAEEEESILEVSEEESTETELAGEGNPDKTEEPDSGEFPVEEEEQIIGDSYEEEIAEEAMLSAAEAEGEVSAGLRWGDYGAYNGYRNEFVTWLYAGTEKEIYLETEGLEAYPGYTVEWSVVKADEQTGDETDAEATAVTVAEGDNEKAVIRAAEEESDELMRIVAVVRDAQGGEIARAGMNLWLEEEVIHYSYPCENAGENIMLKDNVIGIGSTVNAYVDNADHPYGEELEMQILDMRVDGQWTYGGDGEETEADGVVRVECDGEGNWIICGDGYGRANVTLIHEGYAASEELEYTFEVYVNGDVWILEFEYPNGSDCMLTNSTMTIGTRLRHEWYYGDEERGSEEVEDYTLSIDPGFASHALAAEVQGKNIVVQSGAREIWESISAKAVTADGMEGYANFSIWVNEGYYNIFPSSFDVNPVIGEELNLNEADLEVYRFTNAVPEGEQVEIDNVNMRIRLASYDENAWSVKAGTEEELIPVLIRRGDWDTGITLIVEAWNEEEQEWYECASGREFWFGGLNYDTWFENLRGGDWSWVYTDEDAVVSLNTENLEDKQGLEVVWTVGTWDEEQERIVDALSGEDGYYTVSDDGLSITLHGAELAEIYEPDTENGWCHVQAAVYVDGVERSGSGNGIELRRARYDYGWPLSGAQENELMPEWNAWIDPQMSCYVQNGEYWDGADLPVDITDVRILGQGADWDWEAYENGGGQEYDEEVRAVLEGDSLRGWNLTAGWEGGFVHVQITYVSAESGEEEVYDFPVFVSFEHYRLDWRYADGSDMMLTNDEKTVSTSLYGWWIDEDGNQQEGEVEDYLLSVVNDDGTPTYDVELLNAEVTGNTGLRIRSNENEWDTDIWVRVKLADAKGNYVYEVSGNSIHIGVSSSYYKLESADAAANPVLAEEADLKALEPKLFNVTTQGRKEETDVRYRLEYDEAAWEVKKGTANDGIPVLVRKAVWGTEVTLIAELADGDGNWGEVTRYGYWFDDISENYNTDYFVYSYGSRMDAPQEGDEITSRVLTDIPLVLSIKEETLNGLAYDVLWRVWQWDEEAGEEVQAECVTYTVAEDGKSISILGKKGYPEQWADLEVRIIYKGNEIASGWTHVMVDTCEHSWKEESRVDATCSAAGKVTYKCGRCGAGKTETPAAAGHSYSAWRQTAQATVFAAAAETRKCSRCGKTETRSTGAKLAAYAKLTAGSIKMQIKQKTSAFKVTEMAAGDYVTSWKSSNTKVLKVNGKADGTCKLTAQKKTGKATLTITFASGLKKTVRVTVQKKQVATTKIAGVPKKLALKAKTSAALKLVLTPFNSQQKVTYVSSNKKVAAVSSKGKITAKKKGKAVITVTSGRKKVKCTVTVK